MSLYRYFASKKPLPTVQRKSLEEDYISYKSVAAEANFKKLNITFEEYHFCLRGQFEILPCRKKPPIAAGGQIQKPYIYKVRGTVNETTFIQLVEYIKEHVAEENRVEFWSIWHGDKVPSKNIHRLNPQQITIEHLHFLNESENSCIKFFPRNK